MPASAVFRFRYPIHICSGQNIMQSFKNSYQQAIKKKGLKFLMPFAWVPSLYVAEGIPYVIVMMVASVMYKRLGLDNAHIALYTSWLYLPWVIKPFWSSIVEVLSTRRRWIVGMQWVIAAALGGLAFSLQVPNFVQWSLAMLWLMAFSSATHDIAADGFYILALDERQQSFFVGIRSTFYRVASIVGQGVLIMLAGTLESRFTPARAWSYSFIVVGILFAATGIYHFFFLPRPKADRNRNYLHTRTILYDFCDTIVDFFRKPHIVVALLFMLLYRLPEALLGKISPLFLLDSVENGGLGLATGDIGMVQGTIGVVGLTVGGILGGIALTWGGLKRWLWPMVLSITLPDAVYIALAYFQPEGLLWVSASVLVEQFGYGFGFTAYMLYLMQFAKGKSSTAHYAFCTGIMALGMMLPGMVAGYLQETIGYLNFFIVTTILCACTFIVSALIKVEETEEGEMEED